jgi:phage RecT family recombinase
MSDEPQKEKLGVALARWEPMIAPMLPHGVTADRMLQAALLCATLDPTGKLALCTPKSLALGVARIAQWGLEPGVTAHLVPFGSTATAVADYKGLIQLMALCGSRVEAQVVREGDVFEYELGLRPALRHVPARKAAPIVAAYCIVRRRGEDPQFEVMGADEIDAIRQKHSKQWKAGPLPEWYARKTVIRRAAKYVPMHGDHGRKLRMAIEQDVEVGDAIPDAEITPISGEVREIPLPLRAPVSRMPHDAAGEDFGALPEAAAVRESTSPGPVTDWSHGEAFDPEA